MEETADSLCSIWQQTNFARARVQIEMTLCVFKNEILEDNKHME